jgi:hypothetical protein
MLVFFNDSRNILKYEPDTVYLLISKDDDNDIYLKKELSEEEDKLFYYKLDLCSNENKFFINLPTSYYHAVADTLSHILVHNKKYPSTKFIINCFEKDVSEGLNSFYKFFFDALVAEGINYESIYIDKRTALKINNISYIESMAVFEEGVKAVSELIEKYRPQESVDPYRKVFLSRAKTRKRKNNGLFGGRDPKNFNFFNDDRVDSEQRLSEYFYSMGFEIVCPEDFLSFEDQIEYFNSVKTLVSPTSAGLVNGLLMKKNQTIIELEVPMVSRGKETLHSLYPGLLFNMGHIFIMIPSLRNSTEIINKIKLNKYIMGILND